MLLHRYMRPEVLTGDRHMPERTPADSWLQGSVASAMQVMHASDGRLL